MTLQDSNVTVSPMLTQPSSPRPSHIVRVQPDGRTVREPLLMGPRGGIRFAPVWDDTRLITGTFFGGQR